MSFVFTDIRRDEIAGESLYVECMTAVGMKGFREFVGEKIKGGFAGDGYNRGQYNSFLFAVSWIDSFDMLGTQHQTTAEQFGGWLIEYAQKGAMSPVDAEDLMSLGVQLQTFVPPPPGPRRHVDQDRVFTKIRETLPGEAIYRECAAALAMPILRHFFAQKIKGGFAGDGYNRGQYNSFMEPQAHPTELLNKLGTQHMATLEQVGGWMMDFSRMARKVGVMSDAEATKLYTLGVKVQTFEGAPRAQAPMPTPAARMVAPTVYSPAPRAAPAPVPARSIMSMQIYTACDELARRGDMNHIAGVFLTGKGFVECVDRARYFATYLSSHIRQMHESLWPRLDSTMRVLLDGCASSATGEAGSNNVKWAEVYMAKLVDVPDVTIALFYDVCKGAIPVVADKLWQAFMDYAVAEGVRF